ncbi:SLC41A3 [Cordylochernes scorpioides]|uniref:SLC41A3 n=1 Tax=Cordylochernes scorpioides TaxID=51811 RepID=A0ABY6LEK7_9ARAC|nr:SLC41A3 [Cordylochernes scorpioides]
MLMMMVIPGHVIFAYALHLLRGSSTELSNPFFLPIYVSAAFIQVTILIYSGSVLVRLLWRMGADPDNSAIPLLTALGDLLGSLLLALAFYCFYSLVVAQ